MSRRNSISWEYFADEADPVGYYGDAEHAETEGLVSGPATEATTNPAVAYSQGRNTGTGHPGILGDAWAPDARSERYPTRISNGGREVEFHPPGDYHEDLRRPVSLQTDEIAITDVHLRAAHLVPQFALEVGRDVHGDPSYALPRDSLLETAWDIAYQSHGLRPPEPRLHPQHQREASSNRRQRRMATRRSAQAIQAETARRDMNALVGAFDDMDVSSPAQVHIWEEDEAGQHDKEEEEGAGKDEEVHWQQTQGPGRSW